MAPVSDSDRDPRPERPGVDSSTRLISCSADRTLLADRKRGELYKIYERGSMADAEAEAGMGALLAIDGVVRYRDARRDPVTARPCVVMEYHPGLDLEQWCAEHGPLAPMLAARVGAAVAHTLSAMHTLSRPAAPAGVVHCDVKPTNVYLVGEEPKPITADVLLLDLEHSSPIGTPGTDGAAPTFSGGTHGYAPPEAYRGAHPDPGFDVFGLGATLHFMLTGNAPFTGTDTGQVSVAVREGYRRPSQLQGQPRALVDLIAKCLAQEPTDRPSMSDVETQLASVLASSGDEALDDALAAIHREDLERAAELLDAANDQVDADRRRELERLLRRRRGLIERVSPIDDSEHGRGPRELADFTALTAPRVRSWLSRFPASKRGLLLRQQLFNDLDELLRAAPLAVAAHKRAGEYSQAITLLETTMTAARATRALPHGRLSAAAADDQVLRNPIHREPLRYLQLALRDLEEAARTHAVLREQIETAEARIDLGEVLRVLDATTAQYGGASPIVAKLKDRAYRLGFFLERISQPAPTLHDLHEQLEVAGLGLDLGPVRDFQKLCGERTVNHHLQRHQGPQSSLRILHRMLHDLLSEFPHTEKVARSAVDVLDRAMETLTDECWDLIEEARQKLESEPIPVRPLQMIVHRLDAFRRLEVVVDRPDRPSLELLNEHERLRLEVDQARTARDHLARGAEAAMERGHWTTALYDMGRAVDQLSGDTGEIGQDRERMVEQLETLRRTKEEIDAAASENIRLAARYTELHDDEDSPLEPRLATLEERSAVLRFLTDHLPPERAAAYQLDLQELLLVLAEVRATHAEAVLNTTDASDRDRVARETSAALRAGMTDDSPSAPRRQELLEQWERQVERTRPPVERFATMLGQPPRRRSAVAMALLVLAAVVVIVLVFRSF